MPILTNSNNDHGGISWWFDMHHNLNMILKVWKIDDCIVLVLVWFIIW